MRIIDLETINQAMNNETQFVLRCEEVFHDKVSSAAAAVLSAGRERRIVALTGPSGSGKTTTGYSLVRFQDWHYRRLQAHAGRQGLHCHCRGDPYAQPPDFR